MMLDPLYVLALVLCWLSGLAFAVFLCTFPAVHRKLFPSDAQEIARLRSTLAGIASCATCGMCRRVAEHALKERPR